MKFLNPLLFLIYALSVADLAIAQSTLKDIGEPFQFSGNYMLSGASPNTLQLKVDYGRSHGTISVEGINNPNPPHDAIIGTYNAKVLSQSGSQTVFVAGGGMPFEEYCVFTFTTDQYHKVNSKAESGVDNHGEYGCYLYETFEMLVEY